MGECPEREVSSPTRYNGGTEYSGASTNTMLPDPARLYSESGSVAFGSTDRMATCDVCGRDGLPPNTLPGHRRSHDPAALAQRFWPKVDTSGGPDACWPWTSRIDDYGYGIIVREGAEVHAQRVAYLLMVGVIPAGFHVDHQCHNRDLSCPGGRTCLHRRCVNPAHLEAVTPTVNQERGTARRIRCRSGHLLAADNLTGGKRQRCKTCTQSYDHKYKSLRLGRAWLATRPHAPSPEQGA